MSFQSLFSSPVTLLLTNYTSSSRIDPARHRPSVPPPDRSRRKGEALLHRHIIAPGEHAVCRVKGQSFHTETLPGGGGGAVGQDHLKGSVLSCDEPASRSRRSFNLSSFFTGRKCECVAAPEVTLCRRSSPPQTHEPRAQTMNHPGNTTPCRNSLTPDSC